MGIATGRAVAPAQPGQLRLNGVGKFETRNGGALWAGITPKEPVAALAGSAEERLLGRLLEACQARNFRCVLPTPAQLR